MQYGSIAVNYKAKKIIQLNRGDIIVSINAT
jgi:hypothetical protein